MAVNLTGLDPPRATKTQVYSSVNLSFQNCTLELPNGECCTGIRPPYPIMPQSLDKRIIYSYHVISRRIVAKKRLL